MNETIEINRNNRGPSSRERQSDCAVTEPPEKRRTAKLSVAPNPRRSTLEPPGLRKPAESAPSPREIMCRGAKSSPRRLWPDGPVRRHERAHQT